MRVFGAVTESQQMVGRTGHSDGYAFEGKEQWQREAMSVTIFPPMPGDEPVGSPSRGAKGRLYPLAWGLTRLAMGGLQVMIHCPYERGGIA